MGVLPFGKDVRLCVFKCVCMFVGGKVLDVSEYVFCVLGVCEDVCVSRWVCLGLVGVCDCVFV